MVKVKILTSKGKVLSTGIRILSVYFLFYTFIFCYRISVYIQLRYIINAFPLTTITLSRCECEQQITSCVIRIFQLIQVLIEILILYNWFLNVLCIAAMILF